MNLQHVPVTHLMVCTDHATGSPIDTTNESSLKVGVNAPCKCFGMQADWNDQGIGENPPIAINPVGFVLDRIHHDVIELIEKDLVQQLGQARAVGRLEAFIHVSQRFLLCVVQCGVFLQLEGRTAALVIDES